MGVINKLIAEVKFSCTFEIEFLLHIFQTIYVHITYKQLYVVCQYITEANFELCMLLYWIVLMSSTFNHLYEMIKGIKTVYLYSKCNTVSSLAINISKHPKVSDHIWITKDIDEDI